MDKFANILKELCQERNLNIFNLAKLVKINNGTLYKYSNEISLPTINNLVKLANFFECSIDYLVGLTEKYIKVLATSANTSLFYERYIILLKDSKKTHYEIAKKLGYSLSCIQNWKNGALPYIDTLIKIAEYFCVSIDYLVGRSNKV